MNAFGEPVCFQIQPDDVLSGVGQISEPPMEAEHEENARVVAECDSRVPPRSIRCRVVRLNMARSAISAVGMRRRRRASRRSAPSLRSMGRVGSGRVASRSDGIQYVI